jgi:hypothetical protein
MKGRFAVALVVGLFVMACAPAQAIVLRYQPKVGETAKHKLSISGGMLTSIPGMGQGMQIEMTGTLDYTEAALSETAETTRVETRLLGGPATTKMAGHSETGQMPTGRIVADIDRRGHPVRVVVKEIGGRTMMPESAETWGKQFNFPEGNVEVNDSWSDTVKIPSAPQGPEVTLTLKSQLLDLTTYQNRKCAKIRTSFEGPISVDLSALGVPSQEAKGSMEATLQGDVISYYDYENSIEVYSEGTIAVVMGFSVEGPEAPPSGLNIQVQMEVKTTLEE